jgi:hypothetical protein
VTGGLGQARSWFDRQEKAIVLAGKGVNPAKHMVWQMLYSNQYKLFVLDIK